LSCTYLLNFKSSLVQVKVEWVVEKWQGCLVIYRVSCTWKQNSTGCLFIYRLLGYIQSELHLEAERTVKPTSYVV